MLTNILLQVLRGVWMMEAGSAEIYAPLVRDLLSKESISIDGINAKSAQQFASYLDLFQSTAVAPKFNYRTEQWELNSSSPDSIAVIPLQGAVMKQDFCGSMGTRTIMSLYAKAQSDPNFKGIVLYTDSPGGAALGTNEASTFLYQISKAKGAKPSVTYVENMMCSAAMWIGSSTQHIVANKNDFAMIGSIGTYITLQGKDPNGAPIIEIYATDSTQKNIESRQALEGNTKPMLDNIINPLNDSFKAGMSRNRYGKLNKDVVFTGATFQAKDALKHGLVDQIGTFQDAIDYINNKTQK